MVLNYRRNATREMTFDKVADSNYDISHFNF